VKPNPDRLRRDRTQRTEINQAIGILANRGHTRESASAELRRLTDADGDNLREAAE
jgi:hypothetical protein